MKCQDIQTDELQSEVAQLKDRKVLILKCRFFFHKMILAFVTKQGVVQAVQAPSTTCCLYIEKDDVSFPFP